MPIDEERYTISSVEQDYALTLSALQPKWILAAELLATEQAWQIGVLAVEVMHWSSLLAPTNIQLYRHDQRLSSVKYSKQHQNNV
jgi:hypothetical protein